MSNLSTSKPTRMCAECTREFEWAGNGRPPLRCPKCRDTRLDQNAAAAARKPPKSTVARARPPVDTLLPVAPPVDLAAVAEQLRAEIGMLEARVAGRQRALAALDEYLASEGATA